MKGRFNKLVIFWNVSGLYILITGRLVMALPKTAREQGTDAHLNSGPCCLRSSGQDRRKALVWASALPGELSLGEGLQRCSLCRKVLWMVQHGRQR